jgi:hypothetical protein
VVFTLWRKSKFKNGKKYLTLKKRTIRFIHTRDVDLAISLSDAISIENFPSFQIATADDSDSV